ncbi:EamA family transporter [Candidatus Woesearchaeota archaeon]|nr:EamA family transporter [Candidatus Woesearchaeota archaeon]
MQSWILLIIASSLLGSIAMLFKKKALIKEHSAQYLLAFKPLELGLLLFFLPFIAFKIPVTIVLFIFLVSLLSSVALLYIAKSYRHMELSTVAPLTNLMPLFVIIIAAGLLGESVTYKHFAGIGLLLAGTYYLESEHCAGHWLSPLKQLKSKYVLFLLFGFLLSAIIAVSEKVIISSVSPFTLLFYNYSFQSFNFIVLSTFMYGGWRDIIHAYKTSWKPLLGNAFFANLSNLAYFFAISVTFVSLAVPVKRLSSLFAIFLGGKFLKEGRIFHKTIACLIMLAGVFVIAL